MTRPEFGPEHTASCQFCARVVTGDGPLTQIDAIALEDLERRVGMLRGLSVDGGPDQNAVVGTSALAHQERDLAQIDMARIDVQLV